MSFLEFYKNLNPQDMQKCRDLIHRFIPDGRKMQADQGVTPVKSGVLILCYEVNNEIMTVFIRRTEDMSVHSGQIAFPGGKYDELAGDCDTIDTALRETYEEIGIRLQREHVIGGLSSLYIPPSNYLVEPYIAFFNKKPEFVPNPDEVKEVISIPLVSLIDENAVSESDFSTKYGIVRAPCYVWNNVKIWGATAIMLSEFLCLEKFRNR